MTKKSLLTQPFLDGKKVFLRGLLPSDLTGNYAHWFNDLEVCRYNSHGRFPQGPETLEAYYRHVVDSTSMLVLAIIDKEQGAHIGNISLQGIDWIDRSAEYAVVLGEKTAWGKGFAKEASDLILAHGFTELNLNRIFCGTSDDNQGMQSLAIYMGMKKEGCRRQAIFKHGRYRDILEYGVLRDEYLANHLITKPSV